MCLPPVGVNVRGSFTTELPISIADLLPVELEIYEVLRTAENENVTLPSPSMTTAAAALGPPCSDDLPTHAPYFPCFPLGEIQRLAQAVFDGPVVTAADLMTIQVNIDGSIRVDAPPAGAVEARCSVL